MEKLSRYLRAAHFFSSTSVGLTDACNFRGSAARLRCGAGGALSKRFQPGHLIYGLDLRGGPTPPRATELPTAGLFLRRPRARFIAVAKAPRMRWLVYTAYARRALAYRSLLREAASGAISRPARCCRSAEISPGWARRSVLDSNIVGLLLALW